MVSLPQLASEMMAVDKRFIDSCSCVEKETLFIEIISSNDEKVFLFQLDFHVALSLSTCSE